jgi:hypothetical protein
MVHFMFDEFAMFCVFSYEYVWTCIRIVGRVCDIVWDIYIVLFRIMCFGHQEVFYFLGVEKYFYFFYALGQPICIPRRYVVYVKYFTKLLSTAVRRFMNVLVSSACLNKIVSNLVKDCCIILISLCSCVLFAVIAGIYYFWLLGCMSFSVVLRFSVVLQGFFLLSSCICIINTCCYSGWRKSCAYGFLVDFATSIGSRMRTPTM